ncbi:transcription initiation factor tfiid [Anaeramoeba flamelloides]|uniref:Transcription initiation factor tfiid n=1 Tax=Anaeramoeba flamelloides TaxID=1746091 RepID=A0ABQ8XH42_9EUKA|nr:transcription initiation factor tfiid [Anaeramoeba flamelloides]
MNNSINWLVFNYLQTKGYKRASENFLRESDFMNNVPKFRTNSDVNVIEYLHSRNTTSKNSAEDYQKSYSSAHLWIMETLEIYRDELFELLYPLFVHFYFDLKVKGFNEEANNFFENNKSHHEALHFEELNLIKKKEEEIREKFRTEKYTVELSDYPFTMFINFIQQSNFVLILKTLNQFINVLILPVKERKKLAKRRAKREQEQKKQELTSFESDNVLSYNQQGIQIGIETSFYAEEAEINENDPENEKEKNQFSDLVVLDVDEFENLRYQPRKASIAFYTLFHCYEKLNTIELNPELTYIAAGFSDSTIKYWKTNYKENGSGNSIEKPVLLSGHSGSIYSLKINSKNTSMLSASGDGTVRHWSLDLGKSLVCYKGHYGAVWDVDFFTDNYYFATAGIDKTARLWALDYSHAIRIFAGHYSEVNCVKIHTKNQYLATGSSDKTVRLWDIRDGKAVRLFKTQDGHDGFITALAFSHNGNTLTSGANDGSIITWDIRTGKKRKKFKDHSGSINSLDYIKRNEEVFASGSSDNTIKIWDYQESPKSYQTKNTPIYRVMFTPENILLASGPYKKIDFQKQK